MESWKEQLGNSLRESDLNIKEISDKTKIPSKFINAIKNGEFKELPAEIFAKSQIERLFKFLNIDPSEALKEYDEFISPPKSQIEDENSEEEKKSLYLKLIDGLKNQTTKKSYLIYGAIFFIFLLILTITSSKSDKHDDEDELLSNLNIEKISEDNNFEANDLVSNFSVDSDEITDDKSKDVIEENDNFEDTNYLGEEALRKIEIVINGESWVVVFDKNERLIYELMQTGSYEFTGVSPLRFKIGYAPATSLYVDGNKISFSRAIKGATNYAHFWVNEVNKVESIRD
tara:strand:+ start:20959 stop:21819 length:861 start_codon:yes stop_codon:yes gene_type:complete